MLCLVSTISMTEWLAEYTVIWVFTLVAIFSFLIWPQQMIKMILWNYIVSAVILWFQASSRLLVTWLLQNESLTFVWFTYPSIASLIESGVVTLSLVLFVFLVIVVFQKADLSLSFPHDEIIQKSLFVFMVPLTVLSVVFNLTLVFFWANVFDISFLVESAQSLTQTSLMYDAIVLLPVWMTLHALATIAILTYVKVQYSTMQEVD